MKVLTSPDGSTVLTFHPMGGSEFVGFDATTHPKGVVREVPDFAVANQIRAALAAGQLDKMKHPFGFTDTREVMRDVRFIVKGLADVAEGAEVGMYVKGTKIGLDVPESARPNYAEGLAVGVRAAIGPTISPKALMNCHGVVERVNGQKATLKLDAGDHDRLKRATGKNWAATVNVPKVCLEVIA